MKAQNTELFHKNFFLNILILNVVFFMNTKLNSTVNNTAGLEIVKFLLYLNISLVITQFGFFRNTIHIEKHFFSRFIRVTYQFFVFSVFAVLSLFFITPETVQPSFIIDFCIGFYISLMLVNLLMYFYLQYKYKRGFKLKRTVILGYNTTGQLFQKIIESNPMMGYKFIGYAANELSIHRLVLGKPDQLANILTSNDIQILLVVKSLFSEEKLDIYNEICENLGVRIFYISSDFNSKSSQLKDQILDYLILHNPMPLPLDSFWSRLIKRTFDIVFSSFVIVFIISWLFPVFALLIKLSSKGPVLFIQKRTGLNNSTFNCYKFRTMYVNDEADVRQATQHDNRITPLGDFMRKKNLDEFLQFVNVFLGHMSIVGPRPHMLKHTEEYSTLIDNYMMRHFIKPGITGWAQVNGLHGETDQLWKMEKRVEYDLYYMTNWSFWFDLKIIPMTFIANKRFLRVVNLKSQDFIQESVKSETISKVNERSNSE